MKGAGVNVQQIADQLGVTHGFVSQVIHGVRSTKYVREAIAAAVNKSVHELWPEKQKNPSSGHNAALSGGSDRVVSEDGRFLQGKIDG